MGILASFSDFKDFIKSNNKIPEYAREYKREYLYIRGLDYKFKYFVENKDDIFTYEYFYNDNVVEIIKLIKIFLKGEKKGKFKNFLNELYFREYDIQNILFFRNIAVNYLRDKRIKYYYNFDLHNYFFYIFHNLRYFIEENDFLKLRVF